MNDNNKNKCPLCNTTTILGPTKLHSPIGDDKVYNRVTRICINSNCGNFAGTDLKNPKVIVFEENRIVGQ